MNRYNKLHRYQQILGFVLIIVCALFTITGFVSLFSNMNSQFYIYNYNYTATKSYNNYNILYSISLLLVGLFFLVLHEIYLAILKMEVNTRRRGG